MMDLHGLTSFRYDFTVSCSQNCLICWFLPSPPFSLICINCVFPSFLTLPPFLSHSRLYNNFNTFFHLIGPIARKPPLKSGFDPLNSNWSGIFDRITSSGSALVYPIFVIVIVITTIYIASSVASYLLQDAIYNDSSILLRFHFASIDQDNGDRFSQTTVSLTILRQYIR